MKTSGNTVLITGGSSGIGFALASSFLKLGNRVVICGRSEEKLANAKRTLPQVEIRRCDVSNDGEVKSMVDWIDSKYSGLNILVNNAGIQRAVDLRKGVEELSRDAMDDEIAINLRSQIILSEYFVPKFLESSEASAIVNISSGLGLVPLARFPIYCATKAAIHSFTMSLRRQLKDTPVKVFEVFPPTVHDTLLKGRPLEKTEYSVSSAEVADAVLAGLEKDEYEIGVGTAKNWLHASESGELVQAFNNMNR